jgi:hypothetical protein
MVYHQRSSTDNLNVKGIYETLANCSNIISGSGSEQSSGVGSPIFQSLSFGTSATSEPTFDSYDKKFQLELTLHMGPSLLDALTTIEEGKELEQQDTKPHLPLDRKGVNTVPFPCVSPPIIDIPTFVQPLEISPPRRWRIANRLSSVDDMGLKSLKRFSKSLDSFPLDLLSRTPDPCAA